MSLDKDYVLQTRVILDHLKNAKVTLSQTDTEIITNAVREAYGAGYENGLSDGKEISEHPISG